MPSQRHRTRRRQRQTPWPTTSGSKSDTSLTTPNAGDKGISHISFCYVPEPPFVLEGALSVEKDASGSYDRTVEWKLDKTVDLAGHTGAAGLLAGSSTWTVTATKSEKLDNYQVAGTIEISNSTNVPVEVTAISDTIAGTSVSCSAGSLPFTLASSGSTTCTYSVAVPDDSVEENTVEVAAAYTIPEGYEDAGTVVSILGSDTFTPIVYTENLIGYDSGTLSDPRFEFSEEISSSVTRTFPETFACSTDLADYGEDLYYSYVETNTAYLNGNLALEDSASVTVECIYPWIGETATGEGLPWSEVKGAPSTWFRYSLLGDLSDADGAKIIAGQYYEVGTVKLAGSELIFELVDGAMFADVIENVKIQPLDEQPTKYLQPGQFKVKGTAAGSHFEIVVPTAEYGYAIHLDVLRHPYLEPMM